MNEKNLKYPIGEPAPSASTDSAETDAQKENERNRKNALIKLGAITALTVAMAIFSTISWFTVNKLVETNGSQLRLQGPLFSVLPVTDSPYAPGIYDDSAKTGTFVRDRLLRLISKDPGTVTWTITYDTVTTDPATDKETLNEGYNMGNGPAEGYDGTIRPGCAGELKFNFVPSKPVDAELSFHLYAYSVDYTDSGEEIPNSMKHISDDMTDENKADKLLAKQLLNGHILLFEHYDPSTKKYSGLISSENFQQRIMKKTYTEAITDHIYWVWPETLAEIILGDTNDAHKRNLRGKKSICAGDDRTALIKMFKNNPSWFLLNPENMNETWAAFTGTAADAAVQRAVNDNYTFYSAYYNEADQCIGTNAAYLLLDMTAEGTPADTAANEEPPADGT